MEWTTPTATEDLDRGPAVVTGAASGIGHACATRLLERGSPVLALDIDPAITEEPPEGLYPRVCDLTDGAAVTAAVEEFVGEVGPISHVVSNAGVFTAGQQIADLDLAIWNKSLAVNLTSHVLLLQAAIPHLRDGAGVVIMGSRNVPAPGPGAAAYSCAKAAATQLGRVAALELAERGIRVNVVHPDAVFDTAIWTPEVLERSASRYGMTVEEYKRKNLMKSEISRWQVADGVCAILSPTFGRTTGAQVPIDGGNDRVI